MCVCDSAAAMKLLRTLSGPKNLLVRSIGHRYFSATPEEYANRNYANNESEYTTVNNSITAQRKNFLLSNLFNPIERGGKVFVSPDYNQSKEQQREITMKRIGYLLEHGVFKKWLTGKGPEDELRKLGLLDCLGIYDHSLAIKVGVHFFLWLARHFLGNMWQSKGVRSCSKDWD